MLASYGGGIYQAGVISLVLFHIYEHSLLMVAGSRDAFRFAALLLLIIFVINQVDNISTGKARWKEYIAMALFSYLSINGHAGNIYIMLGMFIALGIILIVMKTSVKHLIVCGLSVLLGVLLSTVKTISIYFRTGSIFNSSVRATFHDTPVEEQMALWAIERANKSAVWASYTWPVRFMMLLGGVGLVIMIIAAWRKRNKRELIFSLIISGMLLPMTGIMDWIGYKASLWFAVQIRYRMYFLMLFAITGAWLLTRKIRIKIVGGGIRVCVCLAFAFFLQTEVIRYTTINRAEVDVRINDRIGYIKMADIVASITDGDAFTRDQVLLLYLHGTPKLLYHPYTEELIQAKTNEEIENAMEKLNVGVILLPENGIDHHNYSLLPFWDYINNSDNFSKIMPEEREDTSNKIIFYKNRQD